MSYLDFLKSIYCTTTIRRNLHYTTWTFYNENDELIIFNNEKGVIKTSQKQYPINNWYISSPSCIKIKNIYEFIKQNKRCLLKMDTFVKNNLIIINKLNKILKPINHFKNHNMYGWYLSKHFYISIDLYKSYLNENIYIKTDQTFTQQNDRFIDYKTLFKILKDIDICTYIKNYYIINVEEIQGDNINDIVVIEKVLKSKVNENKNKNSVNIYDEIREQSPELFVKFTQRKKLEIQSCKNFWDFIDFEQMAK